MKVCSLIDTNPDSEDALTTSMMTKGEKQHPGQPDSLSSSTLNDNIHLKPQDISREFPPTSRAEPERKSNNHDDLSRGASQVQPSTNMLIVPESVAMSLLGPGVKGFPMPASLFEEVIRLRTEQEKTEQERLKLNLVSKTKAVLEYAVEKNIPPESLILLSRDSQPYQKTFPQYQTRSSGQFSFPGDTLRTEGAGGQFPRPQYLSTSPSQPPRQYENSNNASSVDPGNFKFGGTPKFNPQSPQSISNRRPRSPAKLGAIAVANLANPITPYRPANRTIPFHQRHYSMPTETTISGNKPVERQYSKLRNQPISQAMYTTEGHTSSMQVRPIPARPLHNQSRKGNGAPQDAMTQHQQVIQFHHWISENPGDKLAEKYEHKRNNSVSSQSLTSKSHKRHKSTDISMDLQRVGTMED